MKKYLINILKLSLSITILYFVFKDINIQQLVEGIRGVNIILLIFAFSLFYIAHIISGFKLSYILGDTKIKYTVMKLNFITVFLNNFIPGSITSDIYKGYKLKNRFSKGKIAFGILLDRISGLIVLLLFLMASGFFFLNFIQDYISIDSGKILAISAIGILTAWSIYWYRNKIIQYKLVQDILDSYQKITLGKFTTIIMLTLSIRILTPIMFFMELVSINPNLSLIPIYYIIFITTFSELVNIIPITIKGYGVRELIWLTLLTPFGVDIETIAILSILIIINDLIASLLGFYFFNTTK